MITLKRHRNGKVFCSAETKLGKIETSSSEEVEEETTNHMKILKDMSKMFHRMTNNEVNKLIFKITEGRGIVTKCIQEGGIKVSCNFFQKESLLKVTPRNQLVLACWQQ